MPSLTLVAILLVAPIGCAFDSATETALLSNECTKCGFNDPEIFDIEIDEFTLDGLENGGIRLLEVRTHTGVTVDLVVHGDRLYSRTQGRLGGVEKQLKVGAEIDIEVNGVQHLLEVAAVAYLDHWVDPEGDSADDSATAYDLKHVVSEFDKRNVCPEIEPDPNHDFPPLPSHYMFAFTGDRYDQETGEVTTGSATDGWLTLTCGDSAPAKLHLTRHTAAGANNQHYAPREQREALMRMYRADFYGNGDSYTISGQPLRYIDANGWFSDFYSFHDEVDTFEALWNQDGAVCLDRARLDEPEGDPIPPCGADGAQMAMGSALFASGNP